ncbi:leucine-rich repeat domain-containing protein [Flavobacterium johnsoniae]|uniref:Leucine-rich repeat domain-containing protein n=1 Tax=Flavobacterium johnsoniae (strain ATCC 17061 / DSM 2064 / JCM 8514 / BCRC 14874 / CCUG 350202 / NBRC 14942 / NCIMB 11054 / UW101) TaxID=376686 RepID=A5FMA9_FLAJ1|nr:hypothetical protein [Flavobacterium johnsoniae]ABQ03666.1 hypothetical protein Fjoh_0631 [Flavobacterium johnsoniae UW101]OXE95161.1 hypothetical protein B0A63_25300 [Flavobacterium johnsoniae UW101]WQG79472.1 hypothetical protein SR927_15725 [Flavobacterium johnsoniae UW101]SHJ99246.1 hypothetical protein SAMN05444146_0028 [Flavobacterium johnsoniae]
MNITNSFTDSGFRDYVLKNFSKDKTSIQISDVKNITSLNLKSQKLENLNGIEYFTSLNSLDCSYNQIRSIDISQNLLLKELICNENEILSLDLSANTHLEHLNCAFNRLKKLNISHNLLLVKLICHWNLLTNLDLENNSLLEELDFAYNHIFGIELGVKPKLKNLKCSQNGLISLDVSDCPELKVLHCANNSLLSIELAKNVIMEDLRCFYNHITTLDISQNKLLETLYCSNNKISVLDTSHNTKLQTLDYSNNLIWEKDFLIDEIGVFKYNVSTSTYNANLIFEDKELYVSTEARTYKEIEKLKTIIKTFGKNFSKLNHDAINFIKQQHPNEDVESLKLSDIIFEDENTFRIGFDAGESPAGQLFLYISFDKNLKMNDEIIYETY